MAIKVPNVGELFLLDQLRSDFLNVAVVQLHLFKNDYTPVDGTTLADLTEADFDGYAAILLQGWPLPTLVGGKAFIALGPQVFACSGAGTPNDCYGYYVREDSTPELLWAERFADAPRVMDGAGDLISITPSLTLATES